MSNLEDLREQFSTPPEDIKKAEDFYNLKLKLSTLIKEKGNLVRLIGDFAPGFKSGETETLLKWTDQEIERVKDEIFKLEGNKGLTEVAVGARFGFKTRGLESLSEMAEKMKESLKCAGGSMTEFSKAMKELVEINKLTPAELEYISAQVAPVPDFYREINGRWAIKLPHSPDAIHPNCRTELEPVELKGESISKEDLDKFFESLPSTYRAPHMSSKEKRTREILTKLVKLKATDEMLGTGIERAKDAGDRFTQDLLIEQRREVSQDRRDLEFDLSKMAQDIPIPNTKPERMGRVKDLQNELKNMESQMETLSDSMNQAIDNEDEMYGGHLNRVTADIERKKAVIHDQLRRLEAMDEEEVSFEGTFFRDW